MPEFRILGPLEVAAADGEPLQLGGQKQRALLAVLLLHANEVVSTDFLIDALWGDRPPRTASTSLQNSISALRKLGAELLLRRAPGYQLVVDPDSIDLVRFERLLASAHGARAGGAERPAARGDSTLAWRPACRGRLRALRGLGGSPARGAASVGAGAAVRRGACGRPLRRPRARARVTGCAAPASREVPRGADARALRRGTPGPSARGIPGGAAMLVEELGLEPGPAPAGAPHADPSTGGAAAAARSERRADCYAPLLRVATSDSPRTRGTVRTYACIVCGTLPELQRVVEQRLRG